MGGIGLQELFILCFTGMLITLHRRLLVQEQRGIMLDRLHNGPLSWRWLFYGMYFALTMITVTHPSSSLQTSLSDADLKNKKVRIIFRICQYSSGTGANNAMLTHEAYEYVLDASPMFLALVALNVAHPGRVMSGPASSWPRLSRKEKKELKRQKKAEKAARKAGVYYPDNNTGSNSDENLMHRNDGEAEEMPLNSLRYQEEGGQHSYIPSTAHYDNIPSVYYPEHEHEHEHTSRYEGYSSYDHARS